MMGPLMLRPCDRSPCSPRCGEFGDVLDSETAQLPPGSKRG